MRNRTVRSIPAILTILLLGWLIGCSSRPDTPPATEKKGDQAAEKKGKPADGDGTATDRGSPANRKVVAAFLVRCGETPYHALRFYQALSVPASDVPGIQDVASYIALTGNLLPSKFICLERMAESLADNLGQTFRSLISYRAFIEPTLGQTVAYDLAITSGGTPQRFIGYRTKKGCRVLFYRGREKVDSKDIDFQPGVEILPISMDFIHVYFLKHPDRKECRRTFYVPEIMGFADFIAKPVGSEMVALGGRNYECVKYLVHTGSSRARAGITLKQHLWFDTQRNTLIKHFGQQSRTGQETVGERVDPARLKLLTPLMIRPEKLAVDRPFPYPLDQQLVYRVAMDDQQLGEIHLRFKRQEADEKGPEGWQAHARLYLTVHGDQGTNRRQEEALTRFDEAFRPIEYLVTGFESAQARADYTIRARFADGSVTLRVQRETNPLAAAAGTSPIAPAPDLPNASWDEPLCRIALPGQDEGEQIRHRLQNERFVRPLSQGTFVHDYHRVEHLAAALYRLPLPKPPEDPEAESATARQRVAFYAVRQNQSALIPFVVTIEPRPKGADPKEPICYVASTTHMLVPGRVLMDDKGRVLQWTTRYGSKEVVYTLDDPIMRKRKARAGHAPTQEGPLLLRPPWF